MISPLLAQPFASPPAPPFAKPDEGIAALVHAIGAKKPGAERELVERFSAHVQRLLTRTLGPGPDVEDLMQEAFFRVFQRLHKVDPPDALPGYVTTVTILVAREALRKRRRSRWLSFFGGDDLAELGSGGDDVPEDVRTFYGAMNKIPAHSQLCISLRYIEGMGLEEMAVAMELSLASVKRHLKRAEDELVVVLGKGDRNVAPWLRGAVR